MTLGLVGRKCGMTRVFVEDGTSIPVTVIEVTLNRVCQVKTLDNDGYQAIQVTVGSRRSSRVKKPAAGHFAKAQVEAGRGLWEFTLSDAELEGMEIGRALNVADVFSEGQFVDVRAKSKGKGFAGVVKRHNFQMQDATHGNSKAHRAPGSIGQCQDPGRVFKGKKMAGQMGNKKCTVQNQSIVRVDAENHLLLVKGTVPGAVGGDVIVLPAVKKKKRARQ